MALETATYIDGLVATNPAASDAISTADDHLRLIKATIKATFPNISGAVTATQDQVNDVVNKAPLDSPALTGTPTAPTAAPGTNTTQVATTAFATAAAIAAFPSGGIIMWSGSIASIPSGWFLCDGANGTPNLRDRFVVGAGSTYAVNATGGSADAIVVSHTHTASTSTAGNHQHYTFNGSFYTGGDISSSTYPAWAAGAGDQQYNIKGTSTVADRGLTNTAGNHTHAVTVNSTGSSGTNANLPPYYALAYIMKA
jgi:hypothetical protein